MENGRTAFLGERYEVPEPMRPDSARETLHWTRVAGVGDSSHARSWGYPLFGSIYSTFLIMPDWNIARLDLLLIEAKEQPEV